MGLKQVSSTYLFKLTCIKFARRVCITGHQLRWHMVRFAGASKGKRYLQWVPPKAGDAAAVVQRHGGEFKNDKGSSKCKGKTFSMSWKGIVWSLVQQMKLLNAALTENWTDAELFWLLFSLSHLSSGIVTSKQDFPYLENDLLRAFLEVSPLLWNIWNCTNNMKPASLSLNSD